MDYFFTTLFSSSNAPQPATPGSHGGFFHSPALLVGVAQLTPTALYDYIEAIAQLSTA